MITSDHYGQQNWGTQLYNEHSAVLNISYQYSHTHTVLVFLTIARKYEVSKWNMKWYVVSTIVVNLPHGHCIYSMV